MDVFQHCESGESSKQGRHGMGACERAGCESNLLWDAIACASGME